MLSLRLLALTAFPQAIHASLADVFNTVVFFGRDPDDNNGTQILADPYSFEFPDQRAENTTALFPMPQCHGITIEEATIDQLQDYMNQGNFTSQQLAIRFLQRIWQTDDYINSVLEINPDFLQIAAQLDAERAAGRVRGPLHGIPYMVKDNIGSADRMETTAGSWALLGSVVPRDAHVVHKLRQAGALLFGKATLSEWADMRSNNYSEGYSPRGGQTRSPYNLTQNPGGSSSGSGSGVAANAFQFALGTETDGSVISPALNNAVVGFKPTVGLTSRAGVVPESIHQDTVGTLARTVRDAVYALDAIYGPDPRDNYTLAQIGLTPVNGYAAALTNRFALQNATFGLPWLSFWQYAELSQQTALLSLISHLEAAGATILNTTEQELPSRELLINPSGWDWDYAVSARNASNESEYTVVKVDFYNNIATYLSELNNTNIRSLEDIMAYNLANDGTEAGNAWPLGHPAFFSGQDGFEASNASQGVMDETYYQALAFCQYQSRENGIDAALTYTLANGSEAKLDALLVPSDVAQAYQVAAQAGYPELTLPVAEDVFGMPFGLGLMQTAWGEEKLAKWASAIEDLQFHLRGQGIEGAGGRVLPKWFEWRAKNVPINGFF